MSDPTPTLHLLCGKIAAGKSTLAAELAKSERTVLIVEDSWLEALYADQMTTLQDYVRCSARIRAVLRPQVIDLLRAQVSVVLDFPANTREVRDWMREIIDQSGAAHQMHVLMPEDDVCLDRLQQRNASGTHPFEVTKEQFHQVSKYFEPPSPEERFHIVLHETAF